MRNRRSFGSTVPSETKANKPITPDVRTQEQVTQGAGRGRVFHIKDEPTTPINNSVLAKKLEGYDTEKSTYLLNGFQFGFHLGFTGIQQIHVKKLISALENPKVVTEKLEIERQVKRIAGPFKNTPLPNFRVSPIGLVPKKQPGKFRITHHLSYPIEGSVNHGVPDCNAKVHFATTDDAIRILNTLGPGCVLSKVYIKSAFKIIPVHPDDHNLLGFMWKGRLYCDRTLPMGCRSSCAIFEEFTTAV